MYLTNAFSLNMIADGEFPCTAHFEEISVSEAIDLAKEAVSAVGHPDTAAVFTAVLAVEVPVNRITVALKKGDRVLVFAPPSGWKGILGGGKRTDQVTGRLVSSHQRRKK